MRLTLIQDGTVGDVVGEAQVADRPDKGALSEALEEIAKQAQYKLVEQPEAEAKAAEEAEKAGEEDSEKAHSTSTRATPASGQKPSATASK